MITETLEKIIQEILSELGIENPSVVFDHPTELSHGDYSTNVAMAYAKELKKNPRELAEQIKEYIENQKPDTIEKIEIAGPGFINFYLTNQFFVQSLKDILHKGDTFGKNENLKNKKAIVEYTDPNPFKEFHIGHLMSNTIGETLSRIVEWNGAETKRACYQGDVGAHVAKTLYGILEDKAAFENQKDESLVSKVHFLGASYANGSSAYENHREEIDAINRKVYDRSDKEINTVYDLGKQWSLEYFEEIYKKLGTKFDFYFFESKTGQFGKEVVMEFLKQGVFTESDGAVIFKGEDHGLHTRVFINSQGLPTYEAKELGLAKIKYDTYPYDISIVVTGNEINDYFKVLLKVMSLVYPELAAKTKHISHGMLRLPTGKMSSRTGDVITAAKLIGEIEAKVLEKIDASERGELSDKGKLVEEVAVAALKYSVLKQSPGKDIIFDFEKSLSFEGDSGPYLQYAHARANSILEKATKEGIEPVLEHNVPEAGTVEKMLYRFPEIVEKAYAEYAPHHISSYLIELARAFSSYYAETKIVDSDDHTSPYKVGLTKAFKTVLKNGLTILGIPAPEKM